MMSLQFERLDKENVRLAWDFRVSPSSCKNPGYYSDYIRFHALGDYQKGLGVTHLLLDSDNKKIAGYVTLRASSLLSESTDGVKHGQPALEIAELAVAEGYERRGVGKVLVAFAIDTANELREKEVSFRHLFVCSDPSSTGFYIKCGFGELSSVYDALHDGLNDGCTPMYVTLPEIET